jgi:hypothetical protein
VVPDEIDAIRLTVFNEDRSTARWGLHELVSPGELSDTDAGEQAPDAAVAMDADPAEADGGLAEDAGVESGDAEPDAALAPPMPPEPIPEGPAVDLVLKVPDGDGRTWVRVEGLIEGVVAVTAEVRPTERGDARLALNRACLGIDCPLGQTCAAPMEESADSEERVARRLEIAAGSPAVESPLLVTINGQVQGAAAYVNLFHPAYDSVTIEVVDPGGTAHVVHDGPGGDAYGGSAVRRFPLDAVSGQPASGRWLLRITDHRDQGDGADGALEGWGIDFSYGAQARCELVPAGGTCP